MNKTSESLIQTSQSGAYISPHCRILQFNIEGILCQSLPGDNIGDWGSGGREDLDSDW